MVFNLSKLRGRIIEKFGTYAAFAEVIGKTKSTLAGKLSNKSRITADEMVEWSAPWLLDIPAEEIHVYFLTQKV